MNEIAKVTGSEVAASRWWTIHQNNSGGSWVTDDQVAAWMFFEGFSWDQIAAKVESVLAESGRDWCPCCGERWYTGHIDDSDGSPVPLIYGDPVDQYESWTPVEGRAHFLDGRVEKVVIGNAASISEWLQRLKES